MLKPDNKFETNFSEDELTIDKRAYFWTKNILGFLEKILRVHIKLRDVGDKIKNGNIFVFNHFSRIETFIPQYLFNKKEKVFCRSIAAYQFFKDERFGKYLAKIGAVPSDYKNIIDYLAREALKDYKLIIFPEGSMIKDKKVMDNFGRLSIYARDMKIRREPHTGPAVIGIKAQRYKDLMKLAIENKNWEMFEKLKPMFPAEMTVEEILVEVKKPVLIVPVNITFYPLHLTDNFVTKVIEIMSDVKNNIRLHDELRIESNILFKNTDMDLTLGTPISVKEYMNKYDKQITNMIYHLETGKELKVKTSIKTFIEKIIKLKSLKSSNMIRDNYMKNIYRLVTVNPLHLVSEMLFQLLGNNEKIIIEKKEFYIKLYLAVIKMQKNKEIKFHRDMVFLDRYQQIIDGNFQPLENLLGHLNDEQIVLIKEDKLIITNRLLSTHSFDEIRIKNIPMVLKNEIQPIYEVKQVVHSVLSENKKYLNNLLIDSLYKDEINTFNYYKNKYSGQKYMNLNDQEKDNLPGEPFFLKQPPYEKNKTGVLLVHGFSASPQEFRYIGEKLFEAGYTVFGVRLAGHGTSPYDLAGCEWLHWYKSVERGYNILSHYTDKVIAAGFSMGGSLVLHLAFYEKKLAGIIAISAPIIIRDPYGKYLFLLPAITKINSLVKAVSGGDEGLVDFINSDPENIKINYKHLPLKGIYELIRLTNKVRGELKDIKQPILIMHADKDPEIDIEGSKIIYNEISSQDKELHFIDSPKHVIVTGEIQEVVDKIIGFVKKIAPITSN